MNSQARLALLAAAVGGAGALLRRRRPESSPPPPPVTTQSSPGQIADLQQAYGGDMVPSPGGSTPKPS